jgi:ribonuclease H2 subunit A
MMISEDDKKMIEELLNDAPSYEKLKKEKWEMGIDEAGRGPVLGPMVYGACAWPIRYKEKLSEFEFADSKQLKEEDRDYLNEVLGKLKGQLLHAQVTILDPELISNKMCRKDKESLNQLSHTTAINLIQAFLDEGINLSHVYLDTVGPPQSYHSLLERTFHGSYPHLSFTVSEKADSKFKVVSAASIFAKVSRDQTLKNWEFREKGVSVSRNFGSGYPSDPNTVSWLNDSVHPIFGFPDIVRFSWSTCEEILKSKVKYCFKTVSTEGENIEKWLSHANHGCLLKKAGITDDFQF